MQRSKRFVLELQTLFHRLDVTNRAAVRPEETLAYLAITRPEVDSIVDAHPASAPLADIPEIASPSSTRIASPEPSPEPTDGEPSTTPNDHRSRMSSIDRVQQSVLGKRASEDREDKPRSPTSSRQRSDGPDRLIELETPDDSSEFEMVDEPSMSDDGVVNIVPRDRAQSETVDISALDIQSPTEEKPELMSQATVLDPIRSPVMKPPLPARPKRRESTLQSGLRFGLQQDSAEVLINVLSQLESTLGPSGGLATNLIQDLFSCKYRQQISFRTEEGVAESQDAVESIFVHPIIGVEEEGKDLHDCLGELYLNGAEIEYEGKKGYMMDLMDQFPPLLYIQLRVSTSAIFMLTRRDPSTTQRLALSARSIRILVSTATWPWIGT